MADPEHLEILERGVEEWNRWLAENSEIHRPALSGANLAQAELSGTNLTNADLSGADLQGADLSSAELSGANFSGANLRGADLTSSLVLLADLSHAVLTRAILSGAKFSSACLAFVDLTNASLLDATFVSASLSGAKLSGANFSGANLRDANLSGADFTGARLQGANLSGADLQGAILVGADLTIARLFESDLTGADLSEAKLHGTDFFRASLRATHLFGATLWNTNLHELDVRESRGLEGVDHEGPSAVSSQTLERSRGRVPEVFLKGCGLSDWEILAAKLHDPDLPPYEVTSIGYEIINLRTHAPIVPLSVFVSYAREDKDFAAKVEERLDQDGIRFWRDIHHMVAGPVEQQIDRAISIHGAVLLILSEASVDSDWVRWEAERARKLEQELEAEAGREHRHRLCPVALDSSWETCKWPGRLRAQIEDYNILDFSMWDSDEDAFETQYEKLKTGLGIYYRK